MAGLVAASKTQKRLFTTAFYGPALERHLLVASAQAPVIWVIRLPWPKMSHFGKANINPRILDIVPLANQNGHWSLNS